MSESEGRSGGSLAGASVSVLGGTGRQGFGLAMRWAAAGVRVTVGSRDLSRAEHAAARIQAVLEAAGRRPAHPVLGRSNPDAAASAAVVVVTVPAPALPDLAASLDGVLSGQVVVDVTVSLDRGRSGFVARRPPEGSSALRLQRLLRGYPMIAAAFHTVSSALLADLDETIDRDDTLVFAASEPAARLAGRLASLLGMRPVRAGDLASAWAAEEMVALLLNLQHRYRRGARAGIRLTHLALRDFPRRAGPPPPR